jgi:hypothetical protein
MSVMIFLEQATTNIFAEMMCKQLIFCVKAATRLTSIYKKKKFYFIVKIVAIYGLFYSWSYHIYHKL